MLGYIVEEFIILPVVYPCGTVSVSSLGSFSSVGSSSKTSHAFISSEDRQHNCEKSSSLLR